MGVAGMASRLRPRGSVSLQGWVGLHRSYAFASSSMDELQLIRKVFGGTLNDVVLAVLSGAYRAVLLHHGDDLRGPIRTLVPVSVRAAGERALDNRVAALVCELPVHLTDPLERLQYVSKRMTELKASHMAEASAFLAGLGDLAPPFLVGAVTRMIARKMNRTAPRSFATVTTHVPGPRHTLFFLGKKLMHYYPYVPIAQGTRLSSAVLTYAGEVSYGVTADPEHVPDIDLFIRSIADDTRLLAERARLAAQAPTAPEPAERAGG
jgi:diacylglycerol O-acyltransferase